MWIAVQYREGMPSAVNPYESPNPVEPKAEVPVDCEEKETPFWQAAIILFVIFVAPAMVLAYTVFASFISTPS